jgi:type II secretory pathway pseudopilin PulG
VELLVVVDVIGILATLLSPALSRAREQAQCGAEQSGFPMAA